ncbi:MAG: glycosyltransferase family 39 protein [Chitinophagales bacterium]|nr:glycosyltransferase family 39 protein [Chitinophagales bacterium]
MKGTFEKNTGITGREAGLILLLFVISRIIIRIIGIEMDYQALYRNWQYLSVDTLHHDLLQGIWYDHTQPPLFNLLLGAVLKISGTSAPLVFSLFFKLITLLNVFLLLRLLKENTNHKNIPLLFSLIYLLSPATMLFENELFYTSFITLLLLLSCNYLLQYRVSGKPGKLLGFFLPLALICLTRSMYHLAWLLIPWLFLFVSSRKQKSTRKILLTGLFFIAVVAGWYIKNYMIFGSFTSSTWGGMNIARNVFHDAVISDTGRIASIEPFSKISAYKNFLPPDPAATFKGLNDRDLLQEMKNDSFINEKHAGYIDISRQYMQASKQHIRDHPGAYLKNVVQSAIIFFAPATRYPVNEAQARKIKYYDLLYSFNLSHLAEGKQERRIALTLSALPKFIIYLLVFLVIIRNWMQKKQITLLHLFIIYTIGYIFCISSLFEHYENMRFRYEAEPLFLVLAAGVLTEWINKRSNKKKQAI